MNQLEVLLLPPGRNASPLQGHLPVIHQASLTIFCYPFILLGTERHCERKMFCPRTQHFDCARSQTWTSQPAVQCCDCYKPNTASHTHRPNKWACIGALSHKQPSLKKVNTSLQKNRSHATILTNLFQSFSKVVHNKVQSDQNQHSHNKCQWSWKHMRNVRQLVHPEVVLPPSSPLGNQKKGCPNW